MAEPDNFTVIRKMAAQRTLLGLSTLARHWNEIMQQPCMKHAYRC